MTDKTRAIVLRTISYSDTSSVVNLYSRNHGRIAVMAKGVKRGRRPGRSALLRPLTILDTEIKESSGQVHQLRNYSLAYVPVTVPHSVVKTSLTIFLSEVLCSALREETGDQRLYDYIEGAAIELDSCGSGVANFHLMFMLGLSRHLGFAPVTGQPAPPLVSDMANGVISAAGCMERAAPYDSAIADNICMAELIESLTCMTFTQLDQIKIGSSQRKALLNLLLQYYSEHIPGFRKIGSQLVLGDLFA